jgi:3-hydroxyacyl-CoA dehydrogenase / enoyl-CoA hydratase / 3-hydroxybutyryl-CoA epimerase
VDRVVPAAALRDAARQLAMQPGTRKRAALSQRLLNLPLVRGLVADRIEAQVRRRARKEHYPAPYAIVDLWRRHGASVRTGYEAEARSVARLVCTPTSRNLVRVFFLQERLKALGGKDLPAGGHVHVVGAGVMGGDIAAWCALRGFSVTLQDRTLELVQPALVRARAFFDKRSRVPGKADEQMARLEADVAGHGAARADVVIEAIFENLDAKRELYARPRATAQAGRDSREQYVQPDARAAGRRAGRPGTTRGPALFQSGRADAAGRGGRVRGDVPAGARRCPRLHARDRQAAAATRSAPGFLVNRVLMPYMTEAMLAAAEGVPLAAIDDVAVRFGMPMGPIELADIVGLDVCLHVGRILSEAFGGPAPDAVAPLVEAGKLGKKSGQGLYDWRDGKAVKVPVDPGYRVPAELEDRLMLALANEAMAVLREGVVADADLIDAGVIFGSGFAPFRGGPLRYVQERGVAEVVARLESLAAHHGERFRPDPGWARFGAAGGP